MKVAIVGSRGIGERAYAAISENLPAGCSEIISGGARGVDTLAERYAADNGILMTPILPDYDAYDKAAPLIRNSEIVSRADYVLIIWDGVSRGTHNVIITCIKKNKPYKLIIIKT